MKILLPVDGSEHTKRMLAYIAAHDELLGAGHEYLVFTVVGAIPPSASRMLDAKVVADHYIEQAEQVLAPVRAFIAQQPWNARVSHAHGPAAELIAALTTAEKIDLIVMGTHGHSALANVVLGSVVNGVLARCKVPVLLIR